MAYIDIPKDLNRIQSKVLLNFNKRQLIGFGTGGILGGITFFTTRVAVGNTIATFLLMFVAIPFMFYGIYEPTGLSVEEYIKAMLRFLFVSNGLRPYKTENIYLLLENLNEKEDETVGNKKHKDSPAKKKRRKQQNNQTTRTKS